MEDLERYMPLCGFIVYGCGEINLRYVRKIHSVSHREYSSLPIETPVCEFCTGK
jgi:hypothetical protein